MREPKPFFSIIIPTYDRPDALAACLGGVAELTFPRDRFEVIVSDDGSGISLGVVVAPLRERLHITLLRHGNAGPGAARNRGATQARGTYLAFLDDDCVPAPDWLKALERQFSHKPNQLIAGASVNALPGNPYSTATQLIVTYVHECSSRRREGIRVFNSTNLAVPAELFHRLGGFSTSLRTAEDYDFCHRWQHAGFGATYLPDAIVRHAHVLTLPTFCGQHFRYGRGLLRYRTRVAARTRQRLRGEPLSFYLGLLRFPLKGGRGPRVWLHAFLVAASQVLVAAGVLREGAAQGWRRCLPGCSRAASAPDARADRTGV